MMMEKTRTMTLLVVGGACTMAAAFGADQENPQARKDALDTVVVTTARMVEPLTIVTDPRTPRQPLPAHDGADYLKTIPGFSVIRKGGTDGDPVFRGMAASRVGIQIDGEQVLGGCGMRMDPPTAYVFPEVFDRIVVVKGPQTVLQGPGASAASVSFERERDTYREPSWRASASLLGASFGRRDMVANVRLGSPRFAAELAATRAEADDFADGAGRAVHSAYDRWSLNGAVAWTPDDDTRLELTMARSDGQAAYADRGMDGVRFERDNVGLRWERRQPTPTVERVRAQVFHNYVDHVMDNFSLRDFVASPMMPGRAVSNPDRRTAGARVEVDWLPRENVKSVLGIEWQENQHRLRSTMNELMNPYGSLPRVEDARFRSDSLFAEVRWRTSLRGQWIAGGRLDRWNAEDSRSAVPVGMTSVPNPTAGQQRRTTLGSGFARYEYSPERLGTLFAGLGHVERFPDYWELISSGKESTTTLSAFNTRPERTTQIDAGVMRRSGSVEWSVSVFLSDVDDFILVQSNYPKAMRSTTVVRNVDARTWGGEADARMELGAHWRMSGSLMHTRGENLTDGLPLGQIAPFEARLSLDYERLNWSAGALLRAVDRQDRIAVNQGNIVGQDLGPTAGFAVLSIYGSWRGSEALRVVAGIDNVLDKNYSEHLSRGGAMVTGFERTAKVNEPGRTAWIKIMADWP